MEDLQRRLERLKDGDTFCLEDIWYEKQGYSLVPLKSKPSARADEPRSESRSRDSLRFKDMNAHANEDQPAPGNYEHKGPRGSLAESAEARRLGAEQPSRRDVQNKPRKENDGRHISRQVNLGQSYQESGEVGRLSSHVDALNLGPRDRRLQGSQSAPYTSIDRHIQEDPSSRRQQHEKATPTGNPRALSRDQYSAVRPGHVMETEATVEDDEEMKTTESDFKYLTGVMKVFACIPFREFDERAEFLVDNSELREANLAIFLREAIWQKLRGKAEMAQLCAQSLTLLKIWKDMKSRDIFKHADRLMERRDQEMEAYRALYEGVDAAINKGVSEKASRTSTSTAPALPPARQDFQQDAVPTIRKPSNANVRARSAVPNVETPQQYTNTTGFPRLQYDQVYQIANGSNVDPRVRGLQPPPQSSRPRSGSGAARSNPPDARPDTGTRSGYDQQRPQVVSSRHSSNTDSTRPRDDFSNPRNSNPKYFERVPEERDTQESLDIDEILNGISKVGNKEPPKQIIQPDNFAGEDAQKMKALSSLYRVPSNGRKFFEPGRVFAVLWSQPAGESHRPRSQKAIDTLEDPVPADKVHYNVTDGLHGQKVFSQIRRMVVIRNREGYCWCVSIGTYGGQGLKKKGLTRAEIDAHAIVHDSRDEAASLRGEPETIKRPVAVDMAPKQTLDIASRLHFAKPFSVEWNTRVMNVGVVSKRCMGALLYDAVQELFGDLPR